MLLDSVIKYLYIHGPKILGGWEGTREASICNHLTNIEIWDALPQECNEMLMRKCHAYATIVYSFIGAYALWKITLLLPLMMTFKAHTENSHRLVGRTSLALVRLDSR